MLPTDSYLTIEYTTPLLWPAFLSLKAVAEGTAEGGRHKSILGYGTSLKQFTTGVFTVL